MPIAVSSPPTQRGGPSRGIAALIAANVVFTSGIFCHAFLYNFYIERLGESEVVMGNAAAALTLGGLASLLPAGGLVDRVTPRVALLVSGLLLSVGLAAGALTTSPASIYVAAMLAGAGTGIWRVAVGPALMRLTDEASRPRAFAWNVGLLIAFGGIGMAVAGIVPDVIATASGGDALHGIRVTLLAGALASALSVPLFASLRPSPQTGDAPGARVADAAASGAATVTAPVVATSAVSATAVEEATDAAAFRRILPVLGAIAAWMLAAALVAPFLNIFFTRQFSLGVATVGVITAGAHLAWGACVFASGGLAHRIGVTRFLTVTTLAFAPLLLALAWTTQLHVAVLLFAAQGMIGPLTNPLIDQLLLARVAARRHGKVSGWRNAAADVSGLAGASLGGALLARTSFPMLVATAGVVGLAGALGLIRSLRALERVSDARDESAPPSIAAVAGA